jgi:predicted ATP-grasp superfamily ATP-dependent carboligase
MSHLLVVELPGGNDADILVKAADEGHTVSFLTADPPHYWAQPNIIPLLRKLRRIIPAGDFAMSDLQERLLSLHLNDPFDAILCLQDLRIVEAAQIARALGLRHLSPEVAKLARDKQAVRQRLKEEGIPQPPCIRTQNSKQLLEAIETVGLPALVKPADGFGSQNVFALRNGDDIDALRAMPELVSDGPGNYGLGVSSSGAMLVERLLDGVLVGCDTLTTDGKHMLLGVNEKLFFDAPSFAIRGGCFATNCGQFAELEACVSLLLDAVGFDHGAAHIEIMLTAQGPQLIEINPRLVGARIARLIDMARERSIHSDLIRLHVAGDLPPPASNKRYAATRWFGAPCSGVLHKIALPPVRDEVQTIMLAQAGDAVCPPYDNADRLGCMMMSGCDQAAIERQLEVLAADACIEVHVAQARPQYDDQSTSITV